MVAPSLPRRPRRRQGALAGRITSVLKGMATAIGSASNVDPIGFDPDLP
jgi:hypothetical protein